MTSIRRRTATLVALSMTVLLVIGGGVLLVVLRRAMTAQFDEALAARAAALQSLTRFDGTKVEMDFAGESMPRYARRADAEFFVAWVRDAGGWRVLERSESLRDGGWPPPALRDIAVGTRDAALPGGGAGRAVLIEFAAPREHDEESDHRSETPAETAVAALAANAAPAPTVRLLVALPRAPLDRTLAIIGWCIAGVGGAIALASLVVSRWAVSRGLIPLGELSRRVQSLGPETLGTRFESADLPAELRPIAEQLSALLARLEEAFEREKRFSAAASHELRTPIAELRMLLEVAGSQVRTSEQWSRTCGVALGVLARAQSLCETLLRLSRSSAERPMSDAHERAEVGPILAEQAARAVALHGGDARRVRLKLDDCLVVRMDEATLASIVGNLLDNALRHGAATANDPVLVHATTVAGVVRIEITNLAPGLSVDDLTHLFEPFWRKDTSRHDQRCFGLGLAVARTLTQASSGNLTAGVQERNVLCIRLELPACLKRTFVNAAATRRLPTQWRYAPLATNQSGYLCSVMNPAAPATVHTRGEYTSAKEIRMNTTTQTIRTTTLDIEGMTCGHCVQAVTKSLSAVPGVKVKSVAVGSAVIESPDGWTTAQAITALDAAGYPAKAVSDTAATAPTLPAKSGGGCCGGAKNAMPSAGSALPQGGGGAKATGGCCG